MSPEAKIKKQLIKVNAADGWHVDYWLGQKGEPDLIAVKSGEVIFVEVKTPTGRVRPLQHHYHKVLREHGARVFIVRAVVKFDELLLTKGDQ